jgi:hypothetical protein
MGRGVRKTVDFLLVGGRPLLEFSHGARLVC